MPKQPKPYHYLLLCFPETFAETLFTTAHTHTHSYAHKHAHTRTHTHTHTLVLVLVLVFTTARSVYMHVAPIQLVNQQEVTRLVVHICMTHSVQWGTHLWACKTHEMREVEYSLE